MSIDLTGWTLYEQDGDKTTYMKYDAGDFLFLVVVKSHAAKRATTTAALADSLLPNTEKD